MADFEFRRVRSADFTYCWAIYSEAMAPLVTAWNETGQRSTVERALGEEGASIIVVDKSDAGWLYVSETRFDIHLGHLYLEADRRGKGLGTRFLKWMAERAQRKDKTFTLDVMENSRARALYERLGFARDGASAGKIRMQHRAS
jgi:GNAT superfamily N-acetyltransferase